MTVFLVGVDELTKEQVDAFVEFCKSKGAGYWHWISGTWIVDPGSQPLNVDLIRDRLMQIAPGVNVLVIEVSAIKTWSGFGPNSAEKDGRNMFTWLKENLKLT